MRRIKLSDILGSRPAAARKSLKITLGLIITGILSVIFVFVTIYGQYTGNYLISVRDDAALKGIAISPVRDFSQQSDQITFEPLNDIDDIAEGWLNIEEAESVDGPYLDAENYIAYTFYLKNVGQEAVNVSYQIKVKDDYKNLAYATFVKVRDYEVNHHDNLIADTNYSKALNHSSIIADVVIENFKPNDVKKFTFFVWFDGFHSNPSMKGGAIQLEWVFYITSSDGVIE